MVMREIKFRGKRLDNGEWLYGSLLVSHFKDDKKERYFITQFSGNYTFEHEVDPATVGQYTGKCDRQQHKVYEDDIVRDELGSIGAVIFMEGMFAVDFGEGIELQELNTGVFEVCEIIGNCFDNPELLKTE
nr:MAG TPA: YopX protein [Caudoviricetes sp.]